MLFYLSHSNFFQFFDTPFHNKDSDVKYHFKIISICCFCFQWDVDLLWFFTISLFFHSYITRILISCLIKSIFGLLFFYQNCFIDCYFGHFFSCVRFRLFSSDRFAPKFLNLFSCSVYWFCLILCLLNFFIMIKKPDRNRYTLSIGFV